VTAARPAPSVVRAGPADPEVLSDLVATAFHDLAPSRWLIADPEARSAILPGYFRLLIAYALVNGVAHTIPSRDAVALWLPAGPGAPSPPTGHRERLAAATAPWTGRFAVFDQILEDHHPAGPPHQYLAILAVHPGRQGQGIGTALLEARHHDLDSDGVPAYLEASSPRARDLYQRHGYTTRPDAPFRLPGGGPPLWPMWREPQQPLPAAVPWMKGYPDEPAPANPCRDA
jgi:GNAT superfamily N-acetyltransferase